MYLNLIGYRLGELQTLIEGGTVHNRTFLYLFFFALLGAGLAVGVRYELWTAISGAIVGLLVLPWVGFFGGLPTDGGTVIDFMAGSAILTIGFFMVASEQVAVRNRSALRRWITPRRLQLGVLVGLIGWMSSVNIEPMR